MKKLWMAIAVSTALSISFVSCKSKPAETISNDVKNTTEEVKDAAQSGAEAVQQTASDVLSEIKVPTFADKSVNDFCAEYKTLMTEYAALKGSGDKEKEKALETKFTTWANKAGSLAGKLKPEEVKSFNDFIKQAGEVMNKMETSATDKK